MSASGGTVHEDYSDNGDAWSYLSHDQARSRAYRWGEDGLGGICDDHQVLCFALALWNGRDPILKERMFGLTNSEGNHGEDVKEYYFYLDSTPTHSYMKFLYKYPQNPFPYSNLVETNRSRSRQEMEYELLDTGIFDDDRYFDVFVEYAKAAPEDVLIRITICNRGPDSAPIDVLPTSGSATPGPGRTAGRSLCLSCSKVRKTPSSMSTTRIHSSRNSSRITPSPVKGPRFSCSRKTKQITSGSSVSPMPART
ncbi:hypothetical protein DSTSK_36240 [Desulforhabdus sp. TSK]|nr:hypothetical protein [Desulforhabdus sp. TSK]GKT10319.1 hypothetical protein DSTSK_36240 [Desulforhabdus sp. TSK]